MKFKILFFLLIGLSFTQNGMTQLSINQEYKPNKGKFFAYWGWNGSSYSKSDIQFKGANYNFTLNKVRASDRQTKFDFGKYVNPKTATIPQFNFRLGYFINDHYSLSLGLDHMKYVVNQNQTVKINGYIDEPSSPEKPIFNNTYVDQDIILSEDFIQFEHTDGLNYVNIELRRTDELVQVAEAISFHIITGFGIGALVPKTNATIIGKKQHDAFHLSGYGLAALMGINATVFKHFFVQAELKAGYINMPDIQATNTAIDRVSQNFTFIQTNINIGGYFKLFK